MSFKIIITNNSIDNLSDIGSHLDTISNFIEKTFFKMHLKDMFDEKYNKENEERTEEFSKYDFPENISKNYICPISHDVFYNPVTTSDGQTYEKMEILRWFLEGNETSPLTGKKLENLEIVPNIILKNIISDWKKQYLKLNT